MEHAGRLVEDVRALTAHHEPVNFTRAFERTEEMRLIAGHQDGLVSRYRRMVRQLMQRAAMAQSDEAAVNELAREIRKRGRSILYGYSWPG